MSSVDQMQTHCAAIRPAITT